MSQFRDFYINYINTYKKDEKDQIIAKLKDADDELFNTYFGEGEDSLMESETAWNSLGNE